MHTIGNWLCCHLPSLVGMELLILGSAFADDCHVCSISTPRAAERDAAMAATIAHLECQARKQSIRLIAAKGLIDPGAAADEHIFARCDCDRVTTVRNVKLGRASRSLDNYPASMPDGTGSCIMRKWRLVAHVRMEHRTDIKWHEDEINAIIMATRCQGKFDTGESGRMPPACSSAGLTALGTDARIVLCWVGEKPLKGDEVDLHWNYLHLTNPFHNAMMTWIAPACGCERNDPEPTFIRAKAVHPDVAKRPLKETMA